MKTISTMELDQLWEIIRALERRIVALEAVQLRTPQKTSPPLKRDSS